MSLLRDTEHLLERVDAALLRGLIQNGEAHPLIGSLEIFLQGPLKQPGDVSGIIPERPAAQRYAGPFVVERLALRSEFCW